MTVSLQSRTGHTNMLAVVGTLVFTQYWYWYPLAHCLALAFTPTCLIALNAQLKMPKLEVKSNARPSMYAYPAPLEEKKREVAEKVTTAVLSIAARARRRESERRAKDSHEKMDVVSNNQNLLIRKMQFLVCNKILFVNDFCRIHQRSKQKRVPRLKILAKKKRRKRKTRRTKTRIRTQKINLIGN